MSSHLVRSCLMPILKSFVRIKVLQSSDALSIRWETYLRRVRSLWWSSEEGRSAARRTTCSSRTWIWARIGLVQSWAAEIFRRWYCQNLSSLKHDSVVCVSASSWSRACSNGRTSIASIILVVSSIWNWPKLRIIASMLLIYLGVWLDCLSKLSLSAAKVSWSSYPLDKALRGISSWSSLVKSSSWSLWSKLSS